MGIITKTGYMVKVKTAEGLREYACERPGDVWDLLKRLTEREPGGEEAWEKHVMHYHDYNHIQSNPHVLANCLRRFGVLDVTLGHPLHIYGSDCE